MKFPGNTKISNEENFVLQCKFYENRTETELTFFTQLWKKKFATGSSFLNDNDENEIHRLDFGEQLR